ncbi:putative Diguanylate cyclase [[Clostridium] ultunense Esp]|nr:putative Diguanylate cyclase [[Clostridium] ultunense Esp]
MYPYLPFRYKTQDAESTLAKEIQMGLAQGPVGLIYFDIVHFSQVEQEYGREVSEKILSSIEQHLDRLSKRFPFVLHSFRALGDDFYIFVQLHPASHESLEEMLKNKTQVLYTHLVTSLEKEFPFLRERIELHLSLVIMTKKDGQSTEIILYDAIKQALQRAKESYHSDLHTIHQKEFQEILLNQKIGTLFQPIISLSTGTPLGFEALTRGPEGSYFHSPLNLFQFAEWENSLYTLEKIARERAIQKGAPLIHATQKLFINMNSHVIYDPMFTPGHTLLRVEEAGLTPRNIVFEITERNAIEDFDAFKKAIAHYRNQGFLIAVDDAGAGYASLQAILELKPDYIKVDRSLIQNIEQNKVKENMLESFVNFALKMNSKVIAEGIETPAELERVIRLGVHYGQGFFLARPHDPPHACASEALEIIDRNRRVVNLSLSRMRVGEITSSAKSFLAAMPTALVAEYFQQVRGEQGVVILKDGKVFGLVMKSKLNQILATQYGSALYARQPIEKITDTDALVVDQNTPIDAVAQLAISRPSEQIYDLIIVRDEDQLKGVVSVEAILDYLAHVKVEMVRLSNPLTGLPGNQVIDKMLSNRLQSEIPFSLIYADLDYFKWYNDQYGFQRGDQVIRYLSQLLMEVVSLKGNDSDFIGHIGGDDFLLITSLEKGVPIAQELIRLFDEQIKGFYDSFDEKEKVIYDREGNAVPYTGLTLSLGVLQISNPGGLTTEHLSFISAKVKKEAKQLRGSAYAVYTYPEQESGSTQGTLPLAGE